MYLEDKTVRLQLWDTAGQVKKRKQKKKNLFLNCYTKQKSLFVYKIGKIP
jgi:hypothetical protein